jgi:uncharacterized protein (PEP-CTERM system associated)
VPDLFYFDAQAYASMQPATAGLALGGTAFGPSLGATSPNPLATTPNGLVGAAAIPKQQLTQNFAVNASPYLQHRFGDYGIGELRYAFSGNSFGGGQNLALTPGTSASQNGRDITNEGTATFITGSHFDRFKSRVLLDSAQSTGNGVLNDSQRNRAIVATEIPAYHTVSALTTLGYEDLRFSGIPPTHIEDAVWGVGARVSATPDRNLIVMYGRHDGITSPYFALDYALTPLTRLSASYSDSLSTFSQQIAQNLAASDVTASGQTIDARTLLPLEIHNPLVGLQLSLLRIKRGEVSGYIDNRNDHFSLTAYHEEDLVVAEATVNSGTPTRATALIGNWSHDVTPLTTAQLFLGYSWVTLLQTPVVQEQLVSTGASLSYLFNSTLTGTASYTFFNRNANQPSFNLLSNVVLVSLRKTF